MSNQLASETSPYLLQHAHNPVHWQPWSEAAFLRAQAEDKPVLVSIGYATCHWCHVMEKESFENDEVAAYMNEHFVCVKVDREEHPDVDHFYMDALQAMQQSGGWPLNMFCTPKREPFYGGTYFPPKRYYNRGSWMETLEAVHLTWQQKKEDILHQSSQLLAHLQQNTWMESPTEQNITAQQLQKIYDNTLLQYDAVNGGFGMAPKFPAFKTIELLLDATYYTQNGAYQDAAIHSLRKILDSGIYDQVAGGVSRYATDNEWMIPHFEKMLYDNALMLEAMAKAYAVTKDKYYRNKIQQTIDFCNRELIVDTTVWGAALDADSEGVEGKFYTWSYSELLSIFGQLEPAIIAYYGITEDGNWEGVNILHAFETDTAIINTFNLLPKQWELMKQQFLFTLYSVRQSRIRPIFDHKIILSNNAMMVSALCQCFKATGTEVYLTMATNALDYLLQYFTTQNGGLWHIRTDGVSKIAGKLDDYAYFIKALIAAASASNNQAYLQKARQLTAYVQLHFQQENSPYFYFSDNLQTDVLVRKIDVYDGATPSANAVMVQCQNVLANIDADFAQLNEVKSALLGMTSKVLRYPTSFSSWAMMLQHYVNDGAIVKKNSQVTPFEHNVFFESFLDSKLLLQDFVHANITDKSLEKEAKLERNLFVECVNGNCKMPVNSVFELKRIKKI